MANAWIVEGKPVTSGGSSQTKMRLPDAGKRMFCLFCSVLQDHILQNLEQTYKYLGS
jgi:hypothetical protein